VKVFVTEIDLVVVRAVFENDGAERLFVVSVCVSDGVSLLEFVVIDDVKV
jgi:hypothetical protein